MTQTITVFLFLKATAGSEVEYLVSDAQTAAALDTLDRLRGIAEIGEIVVSTADARWLEPVSGTGVKIEIDPPDEKFHFGRRLAELVTKYRAQVPLYVGGGSGALMTEQDWVQIARRSLAEPTAVVTNNFYSSDFAVWSPGEALARIVPPELDNDLAFRLHEQAGLEAVPLPKNAATQLDIDTPADLAAIAFHPLLGKNLRNFISETHLDTSRAARVRSLMATRTATVLITGRVSASMALFLERQTACQWRILSEERGMRASGREARGQARSLLGFYLDHVGPAVTFATLARLADAAIIDSRVLFAQHHLHPPAPDRFYSDLLMPERIADPYIQSLTAAARDASIPVLLGGHSLVSGGTYALAEK